MAKTVAQIAAKAFGSVARKITDAIHSASVTTTTQGGYNPATGTYAVTTATQTGRAVFANEKPITDVFPAYVVGPSDQLILLEGFTACAENNALAIGANAMTIMQVQDIAGAGSLFYVVAR